MNDQVKDALHRRKEQDLNRRKIMVTGSEEKSMGDGYMVGHTTFSLNEPDPENNFRVATKSHKSGFDIGRSVQKVKFASEANSSLAHLLEMRDEMEAEIRQEAERILASAVEQIRKVMPILNISPEAICSLFQMKQRREQPPESDSGK